MILAFFESCGSSRDIFWIFFIEVLILALNKLCRSCFRKFFFFINYFMNTFGKKLCGSADILGICISLKLIIFFTFFNLSGTAWKFFCLLINIALLVLLLNMYSLSIIFNFLLNVYILSFREKFSSHFTFTINVIGVNRQI